MKIELTETERAFLHGYLSRLTFDLDNLPGALIGNAIRDKLTAAVAARADRQTEQT